MRKNVNEDLNVGPYVWCFYGVPFHFGTHDYCEWLNGTNFWNFWKNMEKNDDRVFIIHWAVLLNVVFETLIWWAFSHTFVHDYCFSKDKISPTVPLSHRNFWQRWQITVKGIPLPRCCFGGDLFGPFSKAQPNTGRWMYIWIILSGLRVCPGTRESEKYWR